MAKVIDGKQVAGSVIETVKMATAALEKQSGVKAGLAVVIVGDDPASHAYVSSKSRHGEGMRLQLRPAHACRRRRRRKSSRPRRRRLTPIRRSTASSCSCRCRSRLNSEPVIQSILPEKDVDGLHVVNAGKLATGDLATGARSPARRPAPWSSSAACTATISPA